jgi:hypothetical protein
MILEHGWLDAPIRWLQEEPPVSFLAHWRAETRIEPDCVPVDATPLWHDGR